MGKMKDKIDNQHRSSIESPSLMKSALVDTKPQKITHSQTEWRDWLQEHGAKLLLFARQQTRTQQDAEDVLQEALVRLSQKLANGSFVGTEDNWLPYLYTSIRRLSIDMGRNQDRRKRREEFVQKDEGALTPHESAEVPWFEAAALDDDIQQVLAVELKKLPEKFSEVISLKIWGEQTFQQIADALDISINTVASRYRYGLEQLKKTLQKHRDAYYK